MLVKVRCTFEIDVELPDDTEDVHYLIEEHDCPGTGNVGAALDEHMEKHSGTLGADGLPFGSTCWACALKGKNEIIEIVR